MSEIILKSRDEIELIRESSLLVSKTLGMLAKEIKPGITSLELDKKAEEYIRDKVKNLNNINISEKGEMTVVISENFNLQNRLQVIEESVKKKIVKLLKKMSIKDITSKISKENNISKKIVYDYCLKKKNEI